MSNLTIFDWTRKLILPTIYMIVIVIQYALIISYRDKLSTVSAVNEVYQADIVLLSETNERIHEQFEGLIKVQNSIVSEFSSQKDEFKRLKNEITSIKEWANTELPTDLNRLLQRETIIGTKGILSTMPFSESLPASSVEPKKQ